MKISLLTALPHSFDEVKTAVGNPRKDYVVNQLVKFQSPECAWKEVRHALEIDAERLFSWCDSNGVSVVRQAKLEDLSGVAPTSDIVIVLSHWKGTDLSRSDIASPMSNLDDPIEVCLARGILSDASRPYTAIVDENDARDSLVKALNEGMDNWTKWLRLCLQFDERAAISYFYARCLARAEIDQIFNGHIWPGARLELYDGLWRPSDVAACFPSDWSGIADFVSCTSVYLSEIVKRQCRNAMFRADSRLLKPRLVIPGVRRILEAVCSGESGYMQAAYAVDAEYGEI